MAWFKVDDNLAFNTKVVMAGNEAMGLWVRAGSWSSAQLTDGHIPLPMAIAMATPIANAMANDMANPMATIMRLVEAGLWHEVEGGFQFHDWDEYQPSAEEEKAKRKARSDAGKKGAAARWDGKSDGKSYSKSHGKSDGKNMPRPDPSRPSNTYVPGPPSEESETDEYDFPGFNDFWHAYPRKDDKKPALKAFKAAVKRASTDVILDGAKAYAKSVTSSEKRFIKLGATWLNGDCWTNNHEVTEADEKTRDPIAWAHRNRIPEAWA